MVKETVIIETNEGTNSVFVMPYDTDDKIIVGEICDTISRTKALEEYEVVGELVNGEICLFDSDDDDYEGDFYDDDEE